MTSDNYFLMGVVLSVLLLSSCGFTSALNSPKRYEETVASVLVSEDHTKIVFLGTDYDYAFDAPDILVQSTTAPLHRSVGAWFNPFSVDATGRTTGSIHLSVAPDASAEDRHAAMMLGYKELSNGGLVAEAA